MSQRRDRYHHEAAPRFIRGKAQGSMGYERSQQVPVVRVPHRGPVDALYGRQRRAHRVAFARGRVSPTGRGAILETRPYRARSVGDEDGRGGLKPKLPRGTRQSRTLSRPLLPALAGLPKESSRHGTTPRERIPVHPPSRSTKATPTRWPTRSPTPCSTPRSRPTPTRVWPARRW